MLELGIDEITLVLQLPKAQKLVSNPSTWRIDAEWLLETFEHRADFLHIFGAKQLLMSKPAGYTNAFCYGEHPFYLATAYHDLKIDMGVVVKFSAQALAYYLQEAHMQLYSFLQAIASDIYEVRLSRIDLTADYLDEKIDPTEIYNDLASEKLAVFRERKGKNTGENQYLKVNMALKGFAVGEEMPTVYLGSPKSNSQLRIYDKRLEQIQRKGTMYDRAIACNDWIRFEGVFRNEYAHQLTEAFSKVKSDDEMKSLIAATIVQKYRLMYVIDGVIDDDTDFTKMLLRAAKGIGAVLQAPKSRTFDIVRQLQYLFRSSGTMSTLYEVKEIWGVDALNELMAYINALALEWHPNDDCRSWLAKNKDASLKSHPDFSLMLDEYVKSMM